MLTESHDIHRACHDIRKKYDDKKKVIVAPCRCKLYISRCSKVIDFEGKTSPDWVYFASGLTTLVYDSHSNDLMLTLFDFTDLRLLWMFKMSEMSHVYAPNSSFHVINTQADLSEHVGFLYENRDVAALLLNTLSKCIKKQAFAAYSLTASQPEISHSVFKGKSLHRSKPHNPAMITAENKQDQETNALDAPKKGRSKILRSFSFHMKRPSKNSAKDPNPETQISRSQQIMATHADDIQRTGTRFQENSSEQMRENGNDCKKRSEKRRKRSSGRSKTLGPESIPRIAKLRNGCSEDNFRQDIDKRSSFPAFLVGKVEDIFPSREKIPYDDVDFRASCCGEENGLVKNDLRKTERSKTIDESKLVQETGGAHKNELAEDISPRVNTKRGSILKRTGRKISRSLSEKWAGVRPTVFLRDEHQTDTEGETKLRNKEGCQSQEKPRATSDSLLLKGTAITCMVETGHMAKYHRERKQWMSILESETVMTTDLCVTEL